MTTETLILIILVVLVIGALPTWSYSRSWGYAPSGVFSLIVALLLIVVLMNQKETRNLGQDVKESVQDLSHDTKKALNP